jgi:uncharacterized protein (DUF488 family)
MEGLRARPAGGNERVRHVTSKRQRSAGLVGVGYEGRTLEELIAQLHALGISRLVDVRLTPLSRKPGLSKTALGQALGQAGIVYEHRRELGNPKDNRPGFAADGAARNQARDRYAALLHQPEARQALEDVAAAGRQERVAVLCFEADENQCHRQVVIQEVQRRLGAGTDARGGQ